VIVEEGIESNANALEIDSKGEEEIPKAAKCVQCVQCLCTGSVFCSSLD
jgi:hypothetical protein